MIKLTVAAVFAVALTQAVQATPITGPVTGIIQFAGSVSANASDAVNANGSTQVTFGTTDVSFENGSFVGIVHNGDAVTMFNTVIPWTLTSGAIPSFWTVDGFTFDLLSSSFTGTGGSAPSTGFAGVALSGTVSGNGFTATTFAGSFTLQDPAAGSGPYTYSGSFALGSVPDGGTTILLLGSALSGLALLKRKLVS